MIDHAKVTNILGNIPENLPEELIEIMAESREVRVERIVSRGHSSPPGIGMNRKTMSLFF